MIVVAVTATLSRICVYFVQEPLRSPHEYLSAHCPEQALGLMQADPTWVARYESQCTPLHRAVELGYLNVVHWLLEHGADVDATAFNNGSTPLHLATDPTIVAELLRYKPKLNRRGGGWGKTALQVNADMFSRLAGKADQQRAANYKRITEMLRNAGTYYDIHSAIYLNDIVRVREILRSDPAVVKELREAQMLPLRLAARLGRAEICKLLIDYNADTNDAAQRQDFPILCDALEHPAVVKVLLDAGANADVRLDPRGGLSTFDVGENGTLLHYAAGEGAVESVRLLLERNLAVNALDGEGQTPLHVAAQRREAEMVRFLLSRGADVGAKDNRGKTPLDAAVHFGNDRAAGILRGYMGKK
jgi:ankyrin repeat protein